MTHTIYNKGSHVSPVVSRCDRLKPPLACGVPNLSLDLLLSISITWFWNFTTIVASIDLHHLGLEFYALELGLNFFQAYKIN